MTHLGGTRVHPVRCRGGIIKQRALRLDTGNFSWGSEGFYFHYYLFQGVLTIYFYFVIPTSHNKKGPYPQCRIQRFQQCILSPLFCCVHLLYLFVFF